MPEAVIRLAGYRGGEPAILERAALLDALGRHDFEPDETGWGTLVTADGGVAEVSVGPEDDDVTETVLYPDPLTLGLAIVVHDAARATGAAVWVHGEAPLVVDPRHASELPADPAPVVCLTPTELHVMLRHYEGSLASEPEVDAVVGHPPTPVALDRGALLRQALGRFSANRPQKGDD
jgi:hypothetical protein